MGHSEFRVERTLSVCRLLTRGLNPRDLVPPFIAVPRERGSKFFRPGEDAGSSEMVHRGPSSPGE